MFVFATTAEKTKKFLIENFIYCAVNSCKTFDTRVKIVRPDNGVFSTINDDSAAS